MPLPEPVHSSPAIGADGTIYVGCGQAVQAAGLVSGRGWLWAVSPAGATNWALNLGGAVPSSPAIGRDGVVYVGCLNGCVYALSPDGQTNWSFRTAGLVPSSPALASDGTIYIGSVSNRLNQLYAFRPEGTVKWIFSMGAVAITALGSAQFSSPAIGPDGTVYVGSIDRRLYAIHPNGTTNWILSLSSANAAPAMIYSSPAVGPDGTIYIGTDNGYVYAVTRQGQKKWEFRTGNFVESSPAMDGEGNIYIGSLDGFCYALNSQGSKLWSVSINLVSTSPTLGSDGTVYVGGVSAGQVFALGRLGSYGYGIRWQLPVAGHVFSSPAIGSDGTLYIGGGTNLYAIRTTNGLAATPWPMFRRDIRHGAQAFPWGIGHAGMSPGNTFAMSLSVPNGTTNFLEVSSDLLHWSVLTNIVSTNSPTPFVDRSANAFNERYYRLVIP